MTGRVFSGLITSVFFLSRQEDVDQWYEFLQGHEVTMKTQPRTHRDGARSFYCLDPDGTTVQIIHHPPIAAAQAD
jgi:catechol 2,3-dioxygenase-like lactoylglutathione lyase family enzyme